MCVFSIYMTRLFAAMGRAGKSWRKKKAGELGTYQLPLIKALKLAFSSSFGCGEQRAWALVMWPTHGIRSPLPQPKWARLPASQGLAPVFPEALLFGRLKTRHFLFPQIILWIVESGKCVESGKTREKSGISQGGNPVNCGLFFGGFESLVSALTAPRVTWGAFKNHQCLGHIPSQSIRDGDWAAAFFQSISGDFNTLQRLNTLRMILFPMNLRNIWMKLWEYVISL